MSTILAFLACLARLFRPSQAVHASPYGRVSGVIFELRRARSRRVRRYVAEPLALAPAPVVPAPRKPVDALPAFPRTALSAVAPIAGDRHPLPPASIVRPGYRAHERAQRLAPGNTARAVYARHMSMHGQDASLAREWSARCHMYGTELRALADSGDAMAEEVLRARIAKWERKGLPVAGMMRERGRGLPREVFDAVHAAYGMGEAA